MQEKKKPNEKPNQNTKATYKMQAGARPVDSRRANAQHDESACERRNEHNSASMEQHVCATANAIFEAPMVSVRSKTAPPMAADDMG